MSDSKVSPDPPEKPPPFSKIAQTRVPSPSQPFHDSFPRGCAFSPDGLCILTAVGADLQIYNTHNLQLALHCHNSQQAVRSYVWYPRMQSSDPVTCCLAAARREQPIHLYDAYTGGIRASYRPYNALDELEAPLVVDMVADRLVAGGFRDRTLHIFALDRPGRDSTVLRVGKTRRSSDGQKGIISAMDVTSQPNVWLMGTYAPGSLYIYDSRTSGGAGSVFSGTCLVGHGKNNKKGRFATLEEDDNGTEWLSASKVDWFVNKTQGGVTQVQMTNDFSVYSASRRANSVLAWDLRVLSGNPDYQNQPIMGVGSFTTSSDTNQRLEFDLSKDGSTLYVGGLDSCCRVYDTRSSKLLHTITGLDRANNGVSCACVGNKAMLALVTGTRHFEEDHIMQEQGSLYLYQDNLQSSLHLSEEKMEEKG